MQRKNDQDDPFIYSELKKELECIKRRVSCNKKCSSCDAGGNMLDRYAALNSELSRIQSRCPSLYLSDSLSSLTEIIEKGLNNV